MAVPVESMSIVRGAAPAAHWMSRLARAATLAALLSGCEMPAEPSVRRAYVQERAPYVDHSQPCYLHPFDEVDIKVIDGSAFIPVEVNGVETIGYIDTGASNSLITPELAAAAKLTPGDARQFRGVAGSFSIRNSSATRIVVGSILFKNVFGVGIYDFPGSNGAKLGINIGADLLDGLDYDIDFVHEKLRPYSTQNCLTVEPPWPTTSTGVVLTRGGKTSIGTDTASIDFDHKSSWRHITIPVAFPGGVLDALFDTGSSHSLLSYAGAGAIGISSGDLAHDPDHSLYGMSGKSETVKIHHFPDIAIGEDEYRDFPINVQAHFDRRDTPMILGMDYIGKHHFWLSYTTNALYIDSGEKRQPTPPLDYAHRVAGATQPAYPSEKASGIGHVDAACWVEPDGSLTGCHVVSSEGDKAFADETIAWLTGGAHPVMQPAYVNGQPIRQLHTWQIDFAPPTQK